MARYQLYDYSDVWKTEEGTWEVNAAQETDIIVNITEDARPKDICGYLESLGFLASSDMRRLVVSDCDEDFIEIYEKKDQYPLCLLRKIYD